MNLTTVLTHLSMLIMGGLIGYQICNQSTSNTIPITPTAVIEKPVVNVPSTKTATSPTSTTTTSSTDVQPEAAKTKPAITEPIATLPTTPAKQLESITPKDKGKDIPKPNYKFEDATGEFIIKPNTNVAALCFEPKQLSLQLSLFAEQMEKDSLMYDNKNPNRLQDCSGIFHQIARHVSTQCDVYDYPLPKNARDSRSLASWYNKRNNLLIINDPLEQRNLIKPGAVMFFGKSGKKYQNLTVERVTANRPNHIIQHIGVVTEVKKDDNGNVIGYTMLHGRRPGVIAQRSHYHQINPPRLGYPILGNWNQQWVAMAYIAAPKKV